MKENLNIQENVPLGKMTTFKIGGNARYFIEVETVSDLEEALGFAERGELDVFILGGGSNILISDEGFSGLVIKIALKGIKTEKKDDGVYVTAKAGEDWDEFVGSCIDEDLAGLECLSGIPGYVGGTPIQNVGAYGQDVSETIVSVDLFDRKDKRRVTLSNAECGFEYRKSIFNTSQKKRFIVLTVTYRLTLGGEPKIAYKDLQKEFEGKKTSLLKVREAVKEIRKSKGMLVRQGGFDSQSAGSFFKNPIVENSVIEEIKTSIDEKVPFFKVDKNKAKVPAAWLIEKSGFEKGFLSGNVGLSSVHSLALTNRGEATAKDILRLKELIQKGVNEKFGIELIPEPNFIGF